MPASLRVFAAGLLLIAAACGDVEQQPMLALSPGEDLTAADIRAVDRGVRSVGRALAVALADVAVRHEVRDALRDSPWDVHQVSLQDLLNSSGGAKLLEQAARAAGESPQSFLATVGKLPDLDFYMSSREARRSWNGNRPVVVTAGVDLESETGSTFDADGNVVASAAAGELPELLLHPAEPRGRRARPQTAGVGDVIQAEDDGEVAIRYTWTDASGRMTEVDVEALMQQQIGSRELSSLSFGDSTYLDYAYFSSKDSGDDLELTFTAKFYRPDGTLLGTWTYVNYSFPYQQQWYGHVPLLLPVLPDSSTAYIELRIVEDDGWLNPDEVYGPRVFSWVDRGQIRRLSLDGSHHYADIELDWVQRAPSVLTSVHVASVSMYTGDSAGTFAEARDQYGWRMLGYSVGAWSTDHASIATATGSGSTTATVDGWSAGSTVARATIGGVSGSGSVQVEDPPTSGCAPPELIC